MRNLLTITAITLSSQVMYAQQNTTSPVGEYYLEGVMETAAGFKVDADSSFQFFFSYGALDRQGKGRWRMSGNDIIFNSGQAVNDFLLESSEKTSQNAVLIKLTRTDPSINRFFHAELIQGGQYVHAQADAQGIIQFPMQKVDSIKLFFEWCPEKSSVFPITAPDHNMFVFQLQPSILDVQFTECSMKMTEKGFTGPLPFSNEKPLEFRKSQ